MDKNCISALIAEKTIEGLYGKVSYKSSYDEKDGYYELSEWDFSSEDLDSNTIEVREEILLSLDRDIVKRELKERYEAYGGQRHYFEISYIELDEIVMWAKNGFLTI